MGGDDDCALRRGRLLGKSASVYREISTTVCLSLVVSFILADHGVACSKYICPLTGLHAPYAGSRTPVPFANVDVDEVLTQILILRSVGPGFYIA